jgi:predicted membrane protein (TIGR00267 family)
MRWYKRVVSGSLRETIFGLEDGLVSTLGVVTGIVSGTSSRKVVLLSGLIVIIVESLSMAAGTYLSNKAERDQMRLKRRKVSGSKPVFAAVVMFFAYMFGGAVPVAPYLFVSLETGLFYSVLSTALVLFGLGFFKGVVTKTPRIKSGVEMAVVAMSAALVGYLVGVIGARILDLPQVW